MSEQQSLFPRQDQGEDLPSNLDSQTSKRSAPRFSWQERLRAWGVHLLTATGILFALLALIAVSDRDWREVFLWLFIALIVDGVDGTLARTARVAEVLPKVNGKMIDTVIDFTTYAIVPAFFFYQAELAPPGWGLVCSGVMLLAATLYYGKEGMIAESMHFVGFPVLWNVFVFFDFFIFVPPGWVNVLLVFLFAVFHFVPIKFAYPSRALRWKGLTLFISFAGLFAAALVIIEYPERSFALRTVVVVAAAYFVGLALWETYGEEGRA
jgi:phosphatidylcholine synthase